MPELEEMSPNIRQWTWVLPHYLQILLSHLPHQWVPALKQSWVMKITFYGTKRNTQAFISGLKQKPKSLLWSLIISFVILQPQAHHPQTLKKSTGSIILLSDLGILYFTMQFLTALNSSNLIKMLFLERHPTLTGRQ